MFLHIACVVRLVVTEHMAHIVAAFDLVESRPADMMAMRHILAVNPVGGTTGVPSVIMGYVKTLHLALV